MDYLTIFGYGIIVGIIFYAIEKLTEDDKCKGLLTKTWCVFNPVSCAVLDSSRQCNKSNSESKDKSKDKPKDNSNKK